MEGWMLLHGHIEFEFVRCCHVSLRKSRTVYESHEGLDSISPSHRVANLVDLQEDYPWTPTR
jgi:hypothetical protein